MRLRDLPHGASEWQLRDFASRDGFANGAWTSLRSPYLPLPKAVGKVEVVDPGKNNKKPKKQVPAPGAYESVEAALDSKFRQNLRRRRRRLAEKGELKYQLIDNKDAKALDVALADFFDIEASGWKGEGGTAIALKPELVGFYTQLARDAAKRGSLALGLLTLSGKVIAGHFSMVHAGRHYLIKIGYDEALHEHSPGQQMVSDAIRDSCDRGPRRVRLPRALHGLEARLGIEAAHARVADHLPSERAKRSSFMACATSSGPLPAHS